MDPSELAEPTRQGWIGTLCVPADFYRVLTRPAPLAGMRYPRRNCPWPALREAGFAGVVALEPAHAEDEAYDPAPLSILWKEGLQDLVSGCDPRDPEKERRKIRGAVDATLEALNRGDGVVVHCRGGRGRTGTVVGCVLRELGIEARQVIDWLNELHLARGRRGWPESPWQAALVCGWGDADG